MKTWKMQRNCALSPKQLLIFYIALVCLSVTVATGFLIAGVWVIPVFTALELTAVSIGFLIYCRHALDSETIEINDNRLLVRKFIGFEESVYEFNALRVKIDMPAKGSKTFSISDSNSKLELGQFATYSQQISLISSVRRHLSSQKIS